MGETFPGSCERQCGTVAMVIIVAAVCSCGAPDLDEAGPPNIEQRGLGTVNPFNPRRFAMVLVDLGAGVNLPTAEARRELLGTAAGDRSLREYYLEASYGRQDITAEIIGPVPYRMQGCDVFNLAEDLRASLPGTFDHYLWYLGSRVSGCYWTGLSQAGTASTPARDSWFNAAASCVEYVQEPVHNLGMKHSSYLMCEGARFRDVPQRDCRHSEYGDLYDPLGGGCRHLNGYHKARLGWLSGCNGVEVTASGTFTLLPLELTCHGPQLLMVPMARKRMFDPGDGRGATQLTHYYVELRSPRGLDRGLGPVVQIRVSGDVRRRELGALNSWLLNMRPDDFPPVGLSSGGAFSDPAGGVTIRVEQIDRSAARVKVEIAGGNGGPVCLDGSPLPDPPAQGAESCAPSPAAPARNTPGADAGATAGSDGGTAGPPGDAAPAPPERPAPVAEPIDIVTGGCTCQVQTAADGAQAGGMLIMFVFASLAGRRLLYPGRTRRTRRRANQA